jgi:hypothetical protein
MLDDAKHRNNMGANRHDFENCWQTSNLIYENHGANIWLQRGCYPPCEVAKNSRPDAYPLGFSQTQLSNYNL